MRRAVVIAHFHRSGAIAVALRALVAELVSRVESVVLVSTNASPRHIEALPARVKVITRPNVGYDFYSYKIGIESLGDLSGFDQLVILNSSFICVDPAKLCASVFSHSEGEADLRGLSSSREIEFHLQSYLVSFENRRIISSAAFAEWWRSVQPVSDRSEVIARYEIGMSRYFLERGYQLASAFSPSARQKFLALCRACHCWGRFPDLRPDGTVLVDTAIAEALNPTHFLWDAILDEFGIVKIELLRDNPFNMDLRPFSRAYQADANLKSIVDDGLADA